jgi:hypothetical protein
MILTRFNSSTICSGASMPSSPWGEALRRERKKMAERAAEKTNQVKGTQDCQNSGGDLIGEAMEKMQAMVAEGLETLH